MIRQPISLRWRIGLGVASVLVMLLLYTWLSSSRQSAARRDLREVAENRLAELAEQRSDLDVQLAATAELQDQDQKSQEIERLNAALDRNAQETDKFTQTRDNPQALDRTVPSWSMLFEDGLLRATSLQGFRERKERWFVEDFTATGARLVTGLLMGTLVSVVIGILMGCFDPIEAFLLPPFAFFSKVPATAVLPVFFVLIQINFSMYIAIIVFGMLPSLAQAIAASVRKDVPEELIFKACTLGASRLELIWNVVTRQVLPRILDAARLQIGPALVLLVAAEWMVAGEGIGYRLRLFYQRTDMTIVFVYVLILGFLGLAADYGLIWLRRKLCPWFGD